jgi:hypothetical protein
MNKIIYDTEYLEKYCENNNIILTNNYEKTNRDTRIEGECLTLNCSNIFNKVFRQFVKSGGYCNKCSKIKHQNNIIEAVKIKYGVENVFQLNNIKEQIVKTNIIKFGVKNPNQNKDIRQKTKNTCLAKYGTDNPLQNEVVKNKIKETCLKKYGADTPLKSNIVRDKAKQYYLKNFGVEYNSQIPEIAYKQSTNAFKRKTYIFPSGNQIYCQGYEPFALDNLIKNELINETDIVTGTKNVPIIWYNDITGRNHRHYVDIFIPSQNKCIEVKSTWTIKREKDNIFFKQEAGKKLGYLYEIWVYNNKGVIVECHK